MNALKRKVLVVDDDPVIGRSFERVLSDKGYAVATAVNGRDALERLRREDVDVVFTDIKMPGMDGLELAERVRENRPWIPVVVITGYGTSANEARAETAGVTGFLRKPLSPEMIEESTRHALRLIEGGKGRAVPMPVPVPAEPALAVPEPGAERSMWKSAGLLLAAPFVGLAYAIAFPFVGLFLLARAGAGALAGRGKRVAVFAKNVALFFAAPFVGLVYAIAFPIIGLALLVRMGWKAWAERSHSE